MVTVCALVVGDLLSEELDVDAQEERMRRTLRREQLIAFGEVDVVRDVISGITDVAQANGIAGLDSNTIVLGWPRDTPRLIEFFHVARRLERLHKSTVIARIQPGLIPRAGEEREIHIWWGGLQRNGDLMLLLAHLVTRNPEWRDTRIRILSLASNEHMKQKTESHLERLIPEIRISAESKVMILPKDRTVREIIHHESAEADLVFLGLNLPEPDAMESYAERLSDLSGPLRSVFFVKNSSLFVGKLIQTVEEVAAAVNPQPPAPVAAPPEAAAPADAGR